VYHVEHHVEHRIHELGGLGRFCADRKGNGGGGPAYPGVGSPAGHAGKRTARVLIVDDNLALAENIAEILEDQGHTTEIAGTAEEALRKTATEEFSVLVTDFRLPGMNGIDLVRAMRGQRANVVAIVISAHSDQGTADAARDVGARFIEKPLDFATLNRFIRGSEGSA
jgi:DNA-binding NtrC family response regulator